MLSPTHTIFAVALGFACMALDFGVSYAVALASPSYSHSTQYMSELAIPGQPFATLMSAWWVAYGLGFIVFSVALGSYSFAYDLNGKQPTLLPGISVSGGGNGTAFTVEAVANDIREFLLWSWRIGV